MMAEFLIKNKRGDISVTILVIGVLAICTLAIFSFYFSDRNVKKDFVVIQVVEEASIIREKISLYEESLEFSEEEIKEIFAIKTDPLGKHFTVKERQISVRYSLP